MYARPVCLIFARVRSTHLSYNYKVLSNFILALCFFFYKNRVFPCSATPRPHTFGRYLISIDCDTFSLLTEIQNWSMDTLEGLHMYNTVKNHLESHKERE